MTNREQLIQELEQAPDELIQTVLNFLHRVKAIRKNHPLEKFVGILSDSEAEELQQTIVSAEAEHRKILEQALMHPLKKSFAEVLSLIPDVGDNSDFERVQADGASNVFD